MVATALRNKLIKIGARVARHGRYVTFHLAEVAIPRTLFATILRLIDGLRPAPFTAMITLDPVASKLPGRTGVRCPYQGAPSEREMTVGHGFPSRNQPDEGADRDLP